MNEPLTATDLPEAQRKTRFKHLLRMLKQAASDANKCRMPMLLLDTHDHGVDNPFVIYVDLPAARALMREDGWELVKKFEPKTLEPKRPR